MPVGGRRYSSTRPSAILRRSASAFRAAGSGLPGLACGSSAMRPSRRAMQSSCSGQIAQAGSGAGAQGRAEIHLRLRVVGQARVAADALRRSTTAASRPPACPASRRCRDSGASTRLTLPSRIGDAVAPGLRQDRAGGAAADAGQRDQRIEVARQVAAVALHAQLRGGVQVAGAGVVAQPRPQREHVVAAARAPAPAGRAARDEALEVAGSPPHLRLLQHDLATATRGTACADAARAGRGGRGGRTMPAGVRRFAIGEGVRWRRASVGTSRRSATRGVRPLIRRRARLPRLPASHPRFRPAAWTRCRSSGGSGEPSLPASIHASTSGRRKRASKRGGVAAQRQRCGTSDRSASRRCSPARTAAARSDAAERRRQRGPSSRPAARVRRRSCRRRRRPTDTLPRARASGTRPSPSQHHRHRHEAPASHR